MKDNCCALIRRACWLPVVAAAVLAASAAGARAQAPARGITRPSDTAATAALEKAVEEGTAAEVVELLGKGADPNGRTSDGRPFVLRAAVLSTDASKQGAAKLKALLERGANPDRPADDGSTALGVATVIESAGALRLLLDHGADPNGKAKGGKTPLHLAAALDKPEAARILLDFGADPSVRDAEGNTPLQLAERGGDNRVAPVLRSAGPAKPRKKPAVAGAGAGPRSRITDLPLAAGAEVAEDAGDLRTIGRSLSEASRKLGVAIDMDRTELVGWRTAGDGPRKALDAEMAAAGYQRVDVPPVSNDQGTMTCFAARAGDRAVFGMWVSTKEALLLAWAPVTGAAPSEAPPALPSGADAPPARDEAATAGSALVVEAGPGTQVVNVMGKAAPPVPAFPKLAPAPGYVRGYVYDTRGRPCVNAKLGVRSTAAGGFYSGAAASTDAKGYYEIKVPWGVAHFYCAGWAVDYGDGRLALGLYPGDGDVSQFASNVGLVENFVVAPYGVADRDGVQDDPRYLNNYLGGNVILSYSVDDDPLFPSATGLPPGSQLEVTLTPQKGLVDGGAARAIVIRKRIEDSSFQQLYVNNIPAAQYRISARLAGGPSLRMKEVGPNANKAFGLEPKQAAGTAVLWLRPASAKAEMAVAGKGNWEQVSIQLER